MKLAFIIEIIFESGDTEKVDVVHDTWHEQQLKLKII